MKASKIILALFILIILTVITNAQQQFTQTVTANNRGCNNTCSIIELPALNDQPHPYAIIFITQIGGTANPHPIGAYYMYLNKWSIKNTDDQAISVGATFKVEYFSDITGNSGFQYQAAGGLAANARRYIDYAEINNRPNVNIRIFPVAWFNSGSGKFNREDAKVEYDAAAAKWFIANLNNTSVPTGVTYNVVFSNVIGSANPNAGKDLSNTNVKTPITNSPNGNAGGDLSGTYPNPTVIGLQGNPLSNKTPTVGDILRWNGTVWEPITPGTIAANGEGQPGQVLTSNGAGSPPTWKQPPSTTSTASPSSMQAFSKETTAVAVSIPQNGSVTFPELTHTVNLTKKSKLVISAMVIVFGDNCSVCFPGGSEGVLTITIDGIRKFGLPVGATPNQYLSFTISNFMIDLDAGNHNIVFGLENSLAHPLAGRPIQSSVMVIPN